MFHYEEDKNFSAIVIWTTKLEVSQVRIYITKLQNYVQIKGYAISQC